MLARNMMHVHFIFLYTHEIHVMMKSRLFFAKILCSFLKLEEHSKIGFVIAVSAAFPPMERSVRRLSALLQILVQLPDLVQYPFLSGIQCCS